MHVIEAINYYYVKYVNDYYSSNSLLIYLLFQQKDLLNIASEVDGQSLRKDALN